MPTRMKCAHFVERMRFRKMSEQCAFETARAAQEVKAGEMVYYLEVDNPRRPTLIRFSEMVVK